MDMIPIQEVLRTELERRKQKNPAYSLRAFARSLQMSPAHLSQTLSGKRPVTLKCLKKISRELSFSPLETKQAFESLAQEGAPESKQLIMKDDEFRVISDWYHFAILSLTKIKGARKDLAWIAKRLGISGTDAKNAVDRLERMGLLSKGREFRQLTDPIRVISEVPSQAIQRSHHQILHVASERMNQTPIEKRDFSFLVGTIDPKNLEKARKAIEKFQDELLELMEKGQRSEVYAIACQVFPLTLDSEKERGQA